MILVVGETRARKTLTYKFFYPRRGFTEVTLTRTYYVHSKYRDFKWRTAEIETSRGQKGKIVLLQYLFEGNEHSVSCEPHGNRRKDARPHHRTRPSTVEAIRTEARKAEMARHPSVVYDKTCENAGGLLLAETSSSLARNIEQVWNLSWQKKTTAVEKDELFAVIKQCKEDEKSDKPFLRYVQGAPYPMCFLANDRQMRDIVKCCTNPAEFRSRLTNMQKMWETREISARNTASASFYSWFVKYQSKDMEEKALLNFRKKAGLRDEFFYNNNVESSHNVLKQSCNRKMSDWPTFVSQVRELVDRQQRDVERALVGTGPYTLAPAYSHLEVDSHKWYTQMGELDRAKYIKRFSRLQLKTTQCTSEDNATQVTDEEPEEPPVGLILGTIVGPTVGPTVGRTAGPTVGSTLGLTVEHTVRPTSGASSSSSATCATEYRLNNTSGSSTQSTLLPAFEDTGLTPLTYSGSWKNAEKILKTPNSIVDAPGNVEARVVISLTGSHPHFVQIRGKGKLDCQCEGFRQRNLCGHVIATAARIGQVEKLLSVFHSKTGSANLMHCSSQGAPKQVGKKPGQRPRKRKTPTSDSRQTNTMTDREASRITVEKSEQQQQQGTSAAGREQRRDGCNNDDRLTYKIKWLHGTRVRSCYGCGGYIRNPPKIPPPPNNMVLVCKEYRSYPTAEGLRMSVKKKTHYHVSAACILKKTVISTSVTSKLQLKTNNAFCHATENCSKLLLD